MLSIFSFRPSPLVSLVYPSFCPSWKALRRYVLEVLLGVVDSRQELDTPPALAALWQKEDLHELWLQYLVGYSRSGQR